MVPLPLAHTPVREEISRQRCAVRRVCSWRMALEQLRGSGQPVEGHGKECKRRLAPCRDPGQIHAGRVRSDAQPASKAPRPRAQDLVSVDRGNGAG